MNHHVAVVHQYPFGLRQPLVAQRRPPVLLEQLLYPLSEGLDMRSRIPCGNHEKVRDDKKIADFEEDYVRSLLIGDGVGSEPGCG